MKKRTTPPAAESRIQLPNERAAIARAESDLLAAVERHGYPQASVFALRLAFEEAVINAFRHGHRALPDRPIDVSWRVDAGKVSITVADQGPGFDPDSVPDPTLDENLAKPSGRGIMLMRGYMTRVEFRDRGSTVCMVYTRPKARPADKQRE